MHIFKLLKITKEIYGVGKNARLHEKNPLPLIKQSLHFCTKSSKNAIKA